MSSYTGSNSSSGGGGGGSGAAQGPSPATSSLAKHHASANSLRAVAARTAASGALSPLSSSSVSLSSATGARPAQLQAPGVRSKASPAAPTTALAPAPAAGARQTTSEGTDAAVWRSSAAKRAEKAWALQSEKTLHNDAKFRKYVVSVERTLATFESVSEWADFIAFLGRLLKTLQAFPQFNVVPRKLIVAKRLSQCLNPALPSGVHQRALDVYAHILTIIGNEGLRRDLAIWSPGLLPFFQFASTSVKPTVLTLFDRHYLPLGEDLRPVTRALLLALLPGLEEETAEFFERVLWLLDQLRNSITQPFFLQNIWLILISAPAVRLAALNYLARRLPRLNGRASDKVIEAGDVAAAATAATTQEEADATAIAGKDLGLMTRGFAAAMEDETLLVRRAALDLLVTHLRLDSHTLATCVRLDDRVSLVRASLGVVLRRDLSLNRRLYAWLLGPAEEPKAQQAYLHTHALEPVRLALRQDLFTRSDEQAGTSLVPPQVQGGPQAQSHAEAQTAARQRPFRIFVSLLDKWEIGQPLTSVLVLDALRAMRLHLGDSAASSAAVAAGGAQATAASAAAHDISTTAKMLFEVVDPFATYRQFFLALRAELGAPSPSSSSSESAEGESAVGLLKFVLRTFRVHDEESRQIHMPVLLSVLVELISDALHCAALTPAREAQLLDALSLASDVLALVPARVFVRALAAPTAEGSEADTSTSFVAHASAFYQATEEAGADEAARRYVGFQHPAILARLVALCAALPLRSADVASRHNQTHLFVATLRLATEVLAAMDAAEEPAVTSLMGVSREEGAKVPKVEWDADAWSDALLSRFSEAELFEEVEHIVDGLVTAATCRALAEPLLVESRNVVNALMSKLLDYMQPRLAPYHVRAVELLWTLQHLARGRHVESIFCERLTSSDVAVRQAAYEAFGTTWRLTEDNDPSADVLSVPLLRVLDGLRSSNWTEKQASEAWLRTNLRSYLPLLDTLLLPLLDPAVRRVPARQTVSDVPIESYAYAQPFDHDVVNYSLAQILALARFGSQGFSKALRGAQLRRSPNEELALRIAHTKIPVEATYLDAVLDVALLLLRSEPAPALRATAERRNATTHMHAVELLQLIVMRGSLDAKRLAEIETRLIERLLVSIEAGTVERQNKMLHALHTVINARASEQGSNSQRRSSVMGTEMARGGSKAGLQPHALLLRAIKAGLSSRSNHAALQHWADFLLTTTPYYARAVPGFLLPINECICALLRGAVDELNTAYAPHGASQHANASCETSEADITLLLNVGERVLLQCLEQQGPADSGKPAAAAGEEDVPSMPQPPAPIATPSPALDKPEASSGTGLLGYVSGVFSSENAPVTATQSAIQASNNVMRSLHHTVRTLHALWLAAHLDEGEAENTASHAHLTDARGAALATVAPKLRARCKRSLERLYRSHSGEVVEALIDCWSSAGAPRLANAPGAEATFEILSFLAPSAQIVVTFLCDVISTRTAASSSSADKGKRAAVNVVVSEATFFVFLEVYLARLDAATAVQVWPVFVMLVKDLVTNNASHKAQMFPILRCLTTIGEKLCTTAALEDKRMRRDLTENYLKLVDLVILIAGRSFDQSTWIRRSGKDTNADLALGDAEGRATPDEKMAASITDLAAGGSLLPDAINEFLASRALPALRKFSIDGDKIASVCANAVYYIISPALKARSRSLDYDANVLALLAEMARMPGTIKTWRSPVGDTFQDLRYFHMAPGVSRQWQPIIFALMSSDKERFLELVGKVTAAPSANIFTNREAEVLLRAMNLRRLSFVIYSGPKDHFLPQLPAIQEKVVDILRTNVADRVASEVYLCMRVLLCRFSPQHLAGFWPVIITEMMRLFESLMDELPADGSDALHLVLSACKFLDLLLTLQTDDFQIHQWMFVTDTIDVVYPPDDWVSESILDRIASVIEERSPANAKSPNSARSPDPFWQSVPASPQPGANHITSTSSKRKPLLSGIRSVQSIEALQRFFAHVSLASYEATYARGEVDFEAVESGLSEEMFEGGNVA